MSDFYFFYSMMQINWLKKYLGKIYAPLCWTLLVLILLTLPGNMLPSEPGFKIPQFDKFVHFCLFGVFVGLWCLYVHVRQPLAVKRLQWFFLVFSVAVAFGIVMEYVQKYYIPFRDFELGDIIADMIGAGVAYGICNILLAEENHTHSSGKTG